MTTLQYGDAAARLVSQRIAAPVATVAALKAIPAANRSDGQSVFIVADGSRWTFSAACALTGDDVIVISPTAGTGAWLRMPGTFDLAAAAVTFATADAAVVYTVPTGAMLFVKRGYMVNTIAWTGGTNSAIGFSSSNTGFNTAGDLHGGAAGELTAAAGVGTKLGTIGAKTTSGVLLVAADTIKFNRIASVYTAGAGVVHFEANLILNPGA